MQSARGVITSFRSVCALIGEEVAGPSVAQRLCKDGLSGPKYWEAAVTGFRQCITKGRTPQAHSCSKHFYSSAWSMLPVRQHGCHYTVTKKTFRVHTMLQRGLLSAARQHRRFKTQASAKSLWQRDHFSSGYRRGYSSYWDGDKVLYGLIAANCAGFFLWQSHPNLMARHATVSVSSVREGRLYTLLTSAFSHASLNHLVANMFTFYFFGREIGLTFGGKKVENLFAVRWSASSLC